MDWFQILVTVVAALFIVLSCIEVGSNDAANLINAVFGARVLSRKQAILIAGFFLVLGASFSSPVMETVRKGIFDVSMLNQNMILTVFVSGYLVGTVLLYIFSVFGMPVSTTATLVFSLAGASVGVTGDPAILHWATVRSVLFAIVASVLMSGCLAFFVQRIFRGAIRRDAKNYEILLLHGPWITGLMVVALLWFMVLKGMSAIAFVGALRSSLEVIGLPLAFFGAWLLIAVLCYVSLRVFKKRLSDRLLDYTAVLGMACMAFAFGQNDLANCASPGIAILMEWPNNILGTSGAKAPMWFLGLCGFMMFLGMLTKRAQRVTRAEVNTASQQNNVRLYAPSWCMRIAQFCLGDHRATVVDDIAPIPMKDESGKKLHYDALRASVILSVSACVIAFSSGYGLPVSTTYVAFAAVVATGWGDRVFLRGDSTLKMGRAIWVVFGWLLSAFVAAVATALVSALIYSTQVPGLLCVLVCFGLVRWWANRVGDRHEKLHHG